MKSYKVLIPVTLSQGQIRLGDSQAESRKHLLANTSKKGVYTPTGELCFKAGEVIGLAVVSKAMAGCLEEVTDKA